MNATRDQVTTHVHPERHFRRPRTPMVIPERAALRAATAYVVDEASGCWISTYSCGSHGYAQVSWDEGDRTIRCTTAHRAAWVHWSGAQIPTGMTIDHLCKNRKCVNPDHLRMLTNHENARRTSGRDWDLGFCVHGHPNSRLTTRGAKFVCADCSVEWQRTYRAKKDAA
ncbi:MAG: HNH endonuclease signature motif containing protein [Propionibacterium sp.]|nr:HNH endonuclease signature motif containing protein [Propionibacterium sp.]